MAIQLLRYWGGDLADPVGNLYSSATPNATPHLRTDFLNFPQFGQKMAIRPQNLGQKTGLIGRTSGRATSLTLTTNSGVDLEFRGLLGGPVSMVT